VAAFYTAVDAQQYAAAYALLSPAFQAQQPYNSWVAGYATTVVLGADVTQSAAAPNSVAVYLTAVNQSTDFQGVVARYSGTWTLVADGVGGWLLDSANIGVAAEPATYATAASDFTAFADSWEHHGFGLTLDASGDAQGGWRIYRWCSEEPAPPCDELSGNQIIERRQRRDQLHAELRLFGGRHVGQQRCSGYAWRHGHAHAPALPHGRAGTERLAPGPVQRGPSLAGHADRRYACLRRVSGPCWHRLWPLAAAH